MALSVPAAPPSWAEHSPASPILRDAGARGLSLDQIADLLSLWYEVHTEEPQTLHQLEEEALVR